MSLGEAVVATVLACALAALVMFGFHDFGKRHMREEIRQYGCEQAMKAYEAQP